MSIFDSVPFVSEVWNPGETVDSNPVYQAEFLVYTIVERWHRALIWQTINSEEELEAALVPRAVVEGIDVEEPFPFLLYGHASLAAGRFFCDPDHPHGRELSEKAKFHFSIE